MRILFITGELGYRGTPRVVATYAKILSKYHEVLIWGLQEGGETARRLQSDGFSVIVGTGLIDEGLKFCPDVVNIHHSGFICDEVIKIVEEFKGIGARCIETNVFGYVNPELTKLLDVSIQISLWDLWQWQKWKGSLLPDIGVYCPNPVDTESFSPMPEAEIFQIRSIWGVPDNGFVIGRAGKTDWHSVKSHLLDVLSKFDNLYFVSVTDYNDEIPPELKAHPRVRLIDRMDSEKALSLFYSACDVMFSASGIGESFGLVNAEAMACATPVIAVAKPLLGNAQAEVVCNRKGGLVIADARHLSLAVQTLIENQNLIQTMASNARGLIENRYSYAVVEKVLLDIFENRLDSNGLVRVCSDSYIKGLVEDVEGTNAKWLHVAMKLRFNKWFRVVSDLIRKWK